MLGQPAYHGCMHKCIYIYISWMYAYMYMHTHIMDIRVERFRGVFKKLLKCNRQELQNVVPHHNKETPNFFWKSVNIFKWRK